MYSNVTKNNPTRRSIFFSNNIDFTLYNTTAEKRFLLVCENKNNKKKDSEFYDQKSDMNKSIIIIVVSF